MSTYQENRRRLRGRSGSGDPLAADKAGAMYLLGEFKKMLFEGKTPFVSPQDVEREKDRRAKLGLDPDFRDDAVADLLAPQNTVGRQERIDDRLEQIQQRNVSPTAPQRFDNTLEGQYQRYFQTPEMDYVFGAGARGKDAPKDASAMEVLGNQLQAPAKDTNISSMYAAQSAMGRVNEDAIQKMYEGNEAMQTWAKANPMLAQREFLKAEQRRANEMPLAPDNETVMGDLGSRAQMDNPMGQEAYELIKKGLMNKAAQK